MKRGAIKNKLGLSTIIVTLIIILISLVAIGIFWVVINNLIQNSSQNIGLEKLTLSTEIKGVNIDNSSNNVTMSVKRNVGEGNLVGMKFVFYNNSNTEIVTEDVNLVQLGERRFVFHLSMNVSTLVTISIVPIFSSNNGEEDLGNIADSFNVRTGKRIEIPPVGSCTPTTCIALGKNCGTWNNGTCGTMSCGTCSGGQTCNATGQCFSASCTPTANPCGSFNCGTASNGTCGTVNCGNYGGGCQAGYNCVARTCVMQITNSYYVDKNNLSGTCSDSYTKAQNNLTRPWCSIRNAVGLAAAGDTILVQPGIYREAINGINSGTASNKIKIQSLVRQGAILDGSQQLSGFVRCTSQSGCLNNPNYNNLWYMDLSSYGISSAWDLSLYQDGDFLFMSQHPNMIDPFYYGDITHYLSTSNVVSNTTTIQLTDPALSALGGANLIGSYVALWCDNNVVNHIKISGYTAPNTITFPSSVCSILYPTTNYSIMNSNLSSIFERAGEFYYDESTRRVYIWPKKDISTFPISIASLEDAFYSPTSHDVVIDGFKIQNYWGNGFRMGTGIEIKNNLIQSIGGGLSGMIFLDGDSLVENNYISSVKDTRVIYLSSGSGIIRNNTMTRSNSGILINTWGGDITFDDNKIYGFEGVHTNGVAFYGDATSYINNVYANRNIIFNVRPMAFNYVNNVEIKNNVLYGLEDSAPLSFWTTIYTFEAYNNVLLSTYAQGSSLLTLPHLSKVATSAILRNNIMSTPHQESDSKYVTSNNIYTSGLGIYTLKTGESQVLNLGSIFVNPTSIFGTANYHLISSSPAINAGSNLAGVVDSDADGISRPQGSAWDIGAYEFH